LKSQTDSGTHTEITGEAGDSSLYSDNAAGPSGARQGKYLHTEPVGHPSSSARPVDDHTAMDSADRGSGSLLAFIRRQLTQGERKDKKKHKKDKDDRHGKDAHSDDERGGPGHVNGHDAALAHSRYSAGEQEASGPHTTVESWHEHAEKPEMVTTDVDEHGNIIKRTVKTQQTKHTVQRQTYQTYTVPQDEEGNLAVQTIETSRQQITPVGLDVSGDNPLLETHTRTVAYESQPNVPVDVPGEFVSSRTVTSGNRTIETITYKTEKNGMMETHVEHRVTIHSGAEIDHDAELSQAILEATNMNPDMIVEKIEVKQESQS